eukprot:tig00001545_g9337.t1
MHRGGRGGQTAGAKRGPEATPDMPKKARRDDDDDLEMIDDYLMDEEMNAYDEMCMPPESDDVGQDDSAVAFDRALQRPPLRQLAPLMDKVVFQQTDADFYEEGAGPVIRLYGVTAEGNTVMVHVHGFQPYFYIQAPPNCLPSDCAAIKQTLNKRAGGTVADVFLETKQSILYYSGSNSKTSFLRITLKSPKDMNKLANILSAAIDLDGNGQRSFQTYERDLDFVLRFMIEVKLVGCSWVELPAGKWSLHNDRTSRSQLEAAVSYKDVIAHPAEGEWLKIAPLRILSFDIECAGRKGIFPEAKHDPIITIGCHVSVYGQPDKPISRAVFNLKSCGEINGCKVVSTNEEVELLRQFKNYLIQVDPDVITGYNIICFDIPYVLDRAEALKVNDFPFLGRLLKSRTRMRDTKLSSKAFGTHESKQINTEGRVIVDMLQVVQRDHKLRSYTLNNVSQEFLKETKEDVHHSKISDLHAASEDGRRRIASYCLKDAYLPQRLMDKLMSLVNYIEMARVTGVPLGYLLQRGHMIKVVSQLHRKARDMDLLIPDMPRTGAASGPQYEGAIVIDPKKGFYDSPIVTLDFASLYPSIMMAHNLCYSTLVPKTRLDARGAPVPQLNLTPDQYTKTPNGDVFVKSEVRRGILPIILDELLKARKKAKADLKEAKDPFLKAVLDGRQLALKVSANAVYGFTGATVGKLPCTEIAGSVTAFGRTMIERTRNAVQERYTVANGYSANADVVYGDTDSVMINFNVPAEGDGMQRVFELGRDAARHVTEQFPNPVKLEFEKVLFPYLLINKKRYAGLYWTRPEKYDKMDAKGIETARRDNCRLLVEVMNSCLHRILVERDVQGAINYVKAIVSDLLQNRIDLQMLVISKEITRAGDDYDSKQAHVILAERMRKRDAGTAPSIGDRVPFVFIKGAAGAKAYEKAEDPIYVLENNLPLDTAYYLEHVLKQPIMRIFEAILPDPAVLFTGEHTRKIAISTPTNSGLMKFAQKQATCLGCRVPLGPGNNRAVCAHCVPREAEIYQEKLGVVTQREKLFNQLWTQCQRCQGSLHQDVLCTSRDCPIFYMRVKVRKDVQDATEVLRRFDF